MSGGPGTSTAEPAAPRSGSGDSGLLAVSLVVALAGILIPPARFAAWLAGTAPGGDAVTGAWLFKGLLLLNAGTLFAFRRWTRPRALPGEVLLEPWTTDEGKGARERAALVGLLIAAFVLRLIDLGAGLWHDEIATFVEYGGLPFGGIVTTFQSQNQHILYSILARFAFLAFGDHEWVLRLPAVLLGVASLWATWWFGAKVTTRREALLAVLLLTVSYHHIWFSQNARGYTGLMFFTLLGSGLFLDQLMGRTRRPVVFGYAVTMALAVYMHLTAAFVVVSHFLIWAALAWRKRSRVPRAGLWLPVGSMVLAGLFALQAWSLVLPQLRDALTAARPALAATEWKSPLWLIAETVRGAVRGLPGGWLGFAAGALIAGSGALGFARRSPAVLSVMVLPAALTAAIMVGAGHNLWPRFFFFSAGFAVLIAVRGLFLFARAVGRGHGLALGTGLACAAALGSLLMVPKAWGPKQDYRGALAWVREARAPGDTIAAVGLAGYAYTSYLRAGVPDPGDAAALADLEARVRRTWLIYTFPTHLQALHPDLWAGIAERYRTVREFPGTVGGGTVIVAITE